MLAGHAYGCVCLGCANFAGYGEDVAVEAPAGGGQQWQTTATAGANLLTALVGSGIFSRKNKKAAKAAAAQQAQMQTYVQPPVMTYTPAPVAPAGPPTWAIALGFTALAALGVGAVAWTAGDRR